MDWAVIRPTGFFSDMEEYLKMARRGRVYLFGPGRNRINPIHGADLAEVCADAATGGVQEIDVGGPEVLTHREIAELAFGSVGKQLRISSVPLWVLRAAVSIRKIFNKHEGELLAFLATAMSSDAVAPPVGTHRLNDHFRSLSTSIHTDEKEL